MSFGQASARARRPEPTGPCPCGGGGFGDCCGPILDGGAAPTAERLMRSRYSANVLGDAAHLRRTWHPRTRPDELDLDPATRWTGLRIDEALEGEDSAVIAFTASWSSGPRTGALTERSRFSRRAGRWVYVDGDVD